ncbi:MAG: asparaginase [Alphaproteobacteria bacterium]|nr:asparaginase [Alphaproteobacteria bacterium]
MPKQNDIAQGAVPLVEIWRGARLESAHFGHAVVMRADGTLVNCWGRPDVVIYPRSSCKMIQALPLMDSGAGAALRPQQVALACASHQASARHVAMVTGWLSNLGLSDADLRCGAAMPGDLAERDRLICTHEHPCQSHHECSGKHAGFLTLNRHLGGLPDYVAPDHPVQRAVRDAFEEVTGRTSAGYGIDGCSAPNFATELQGLGLAMARYAAAREGSGDRRSRAMAQLRDAMMAHPDMVAGESRACTNLMRAARGRAAVKTGAEAVFVAILPQQKLGIALKIVDGGVRASEAAMAGLLRHYGVIDAEDPVLVQYLGPLRNRRDLVVGETRLAQGFV